MKLRLLAGILLLSPAFVCAESLVWDTPVGRMGLPFSATEALLGYDAILKQSIAGVSLPIYTDPREFVALQVGAVGAWPNNGSTFEPYLGLGHDIAKEIPGLKDYKTLHLNVFGRWATERGKAGLGVSFSYAFGGGSISQTVQPQE